MRKLQTTCVASAFLYGMAMTTPSLATEFEFTGFVEPELQVFPNRGNVAGQKRFNSSVAIEVTAEAFWDSGDQFVVFTPFARLDQNDGNRTHADIRELKYAYVTGDWEFRVGIDKVFWGVTEVAHLVDIINQTDQVESLDGEEKLGQPMVAVSTVQDFGVFDFYLLPYFRERTFPSMGGRPAFDIPVDETQTMYGSNDKRQHLDFATRYSNTFERSEEHTSELQSLAYLVCRLLLEKKKKTKTKKKKKKIEK
mgnify:CR=1 FL=1